MSGVSQVYKNGVIYKNGVGTFFNSTIGIQEKKRELTPFSPFSGYKIL